MTGAIISVFTHLLMSFAFSSAIFASACKSFLFRDMNPVQVRLRKNQRLKRRHALQVFRRRRFRLFFNFFIPNLLHLICRVLRDVRFDPPG